MKNKTLFCQIKRGIFCCNTGKSNTCSQQSCCWGSKAHSRWKNLLLNPGSKPTTAGIANPEDSSSLFYFSIFELWFPGGPQKGFIQDWQRRLSFQIQQLPRSKRFTIQIKDSPRKKLPFGFFCPHETSRKPSWSVWRGSRLTLHGFRVKFKVE